MKSRYLLQTAFALSLFILSNAEDVSGPGFSCIRSSAVAGQTRVTFLHEDAAGSRSLYLTTWSADLQLVACEVNEDPLITEGFRNLCNGSKAWSQEISTRVDISKVLAPDALCALVLPRTPGFSRRTRRDGTERRVRRRRSWILPGTLWCGSGSKAIGYEQLGMFERADRCCREHDHCPHIIPAFKVNYGVFNSNFFTVSHCECDQRFRHCLLGMNDSISTMVGYSFFNILQVPCFELKQLKRCTEMYWWGMCKVAKEAPYAVFKSPLPYNSSDVTSTYEHTHNNNVVKDSEGSQSLMKSPKRKSSKTKHRCGLRQPSRGDTFHRRREKGRGCKRHQKPTRVAPTQVPLTSFAYRTTPYGKMGLSKNKTFIRNGLPGRAQRGHISLKVPTNSGPPTPSTTPSSIAPLTKKLKLHPDATTAVIRESKTSKSHKKVTKKSHCCESSKPVGSRTTQLECKSCFKRQRASNATTITPVTTTTNGLPKEQMKQENSHHKKKSETPTWDALVAPWNAITFAKPITTKLKSTASRHKDGSPQKLIHLYPLWTNTSQETLGGAIAQNIHTVKSLKENNALHNMTDIQIWCGSLKHLDNCKFKIAPLKKKYNLRNMESKTTYHCDCTSRLTAQIKSIKWPSILPSLLNDFVSQRCFTLLKKKKLHCNKRRFRGFAKASDLHQALKKIEGKDISGMRLSASERKRRIPVRLYKQCLRLEKGADKMALLK